MSRWMLKCLIAVSFACVSSVIAQEAPQPAKPEKEHEWLQQLVGDWETHGKAESGPGQPPFECDGTESTRSIGGLWIVSDGEAHPMGMEMHSVFTLGYDPAQKKFVGTWIDSMFNHMWKYEGTLDDSGKVLTLMTEGPNLTKPGEMAKYKEVLEIKDTNHKVFSSHIQLENGEWMKFVTVNAKRVK